MIRSLTPTLNVEDTEKSAKTRGLEQHAKNIAIKVESDKNKLNDLIRNPIEV